MGELTTLGAIADWGSGGTPKRDRPDFFGGDIPWAVIGDLNDGMVTETASSITQLGMDSSSAKWIEAGSVMVAMYGSIGKLGIAGRRMTSNQAIAFARPKPDVDASYLFWYLRSIRSELQSLGRGGTQKNIGQGTIKSLPFVKPSLDEQRAVVDEIEKQFTRLDTAEGLVVQSARSLGHYRRALLGRATEDEGHSWPIVRVEQVGVGDDQIVLTGPFGTALGKGAFTRAGTPVLTIGSLTDSGLDFSKVKYVSKDKAQALSRYKVREDDLLFSRMATVGRVGLVTERESGSIINYHLMRVRLDPSQIHPRYFVAYVRGSQRVRDYLREVNHGATRPGIATADLLKLPIPLPPMVQQKTIIAELERDLSVTVAMDDELMKGLKRASALRRSILQRAFGGELP